MTEISFFNSPPPKSPVSPEQPGLCHTYSFVLDQVVSDGGATIVLLDDVHFDGVSILSYVPFQLGGAGFPCNNGDSGLFVKKQSVTEEKVLIKIRKILHYPQLRVPAAPDTEDTERSGHKYLSHPSTSCICTTPNLHFCVCWNGVRVEEIPPSLKNTPKQ